MEFNSRHDRGIARKAARYALSAAFNALSAELDSLGNVKGAKVVDGWLRRNQERILRSVIYGIPKL